VTLTGSRPRTERPWWRDAVVYQVYPRSFADTDGDGVGDLPGLISRVGYLRDLGVDAIWLSPFYPSPLADGGYDVADHRAVDPRLGTLEDFDRLVATCRDAGIRVMVDIVPNHTSHLHRWFRSALAAAPGSPERARYVFRDGRGKRGQKPPNDWQSMFGGPAWTRVADGQWYLHLFAEEQPDLNWDNPEVREDMLDTLRFWADRGVAGFRVDVAHGLVKDLSEPYPTQDRLADRYAEDGGSPLWDRDEVHEVYAAWRRLFDEYDPPLMAVAEAWVPAHRLPRYASVDGLGQAFDFGLLMAGWSATDVVEVVRQHRTLAEPSGATSTWVLANHDVIRTVTRYGTPSGRADDALGWVHGASEPQHAMDVEQGVRRARAALLLMLALPGSAYLFQGEELGLPEVRDIPPEAREDPVFSHSGGALLGRDGCRVPLPWTAEPPSFGFGPGGAHLPQPASFADLAVSRQERDPSSTLSLYRDALRLRTALRRAGDPDCLDVPEEPADVVHLVRDGGWHSVTNFSARPRPLPDGLAEAEVLLASAPLAGEGLLPADCTAWLVTSSAQA
jgi:alpha-glucosidase